MRKYLIAAAVGALLIAGQAAAQDSDVVSVGDRIGASSSSSNDLLGMGGEGALLVGLAGAAVIGLAAWGFSQTSHGAPASP